MGWHEGRAAWRALWLHIEVQEPNSFTNTLLKAPGFRSAQDIAAVTPEFAPAKAIDHHKDDVEFILACALNALNATISAKIILFMALICVT